MLQLAQEAYTLADYEDQNVLEVGVDLAVEVMAKEAIESMGVKVQVNGEGVLPSQEKLRAKEKAKVRVLESKLQQEKKKSQETETLVNQLVIESKEA